MKFKRDLTGETFGALTVLYLYSRDYQGATEWVCRCTCGTEKRITRSNLISGNTKSCGCIRKPTFRLDPKIKKVKQPQHGMRQTSEYNSWHRMLQRCNNTNYTKYVNYGGRGITVCPEWHDFRAFFFDMGFKPGPEYSLDRVDNDGNYCKENCRWATKAEQQGNKREMWKTRLKRILNERK